MKNQYKDLIEQTFYFPQEGFEMIDNCLHFNGIPLMDIIEQYGTPLKLTYLPKISDQIQFPLFLTTRSTGCSCESRPNSALRSISSMCELASTTQILPTSSPKTCKSLVMRVDQYSATRNNNYWCWDHHPAGRLRCRSQVASHNQRRL